MVQQSKMNLDIRGQRALEQVTNGYLQDIGVEMESQSLMDTISSWWTKNGITIDDTRNYDWITKIIEDTLLFLTGLYLARDYKHRLLAYVNYVKASLGERPLLNSAIFSAVEKMFEDMMGDTPFEENFEFQSLDGLESFADSARSFLDNFDFFKSRPIIKKSYKLIGYIVSMSIFNKLDMEFTRSAFNVVEGEWKKKTWGADFAFTVLDMVTFVLKRGVQSVRTGSLDPFFHAGSTYEEWADKAYDHIKYGNFLQDPEAHGLVMSKYLLELEMLIRQGKSIAKHCVDKFEKNQVRKLLSQLELIQNNENAFDAALRDKEAPFACLIFGGTSIAKSTLMQLLFHYIATLKNLPTGSEYKFTRNAVDEFWNNFRSHHHTLIFDDAAYLSPEYASAGDPSVLELLQIINNICFMPRQAALDDKGRTPMRCQLVLVSTNTLNLNVHEYFSCPLAVLRRFPVVLDIVPKPEYLRDGQYMDTDKLPEVGDEEYPDFWTIKVLKVVAEPQNTTDPRIGQRAKFVPATYNGKPCVYNSIYEFLSWFGQQALEHAANQKKYMRTNDCNKVVTLCFKCHVPERHCICEPHGPQVRIDLELQGNFTQEDAKAVLCDEKLGIPWDPSHIERLFRYDEVRAQRVLDTIYYERLSQAQVFEAKKEAERIANRGWFDKQLTFLAVIIVGVLCDDTSMRNKILSWFLTRLMSFDNWMIVCFWYSDNKFTTAQAFRAVGNKIATRLGTTPKVLAMLGVVTMITTGVGLAYAFWKLFGKRETEKTPITESPKMVLWSDPRVCHCDACNVTRAGLVYAHADKPEKDCACRLCHKAHLLAVHEVGVPIMEKMDFEGLKLEQLKLVGSPPKPRAVEPEEAWPRGGFQLSTYEVSPLSTSLKGLAREDFENQFILRNLRRFTILTQKNEKEDNASKAMCLGLCDFLYAFPTHTIPKGVFRLRLELEPHNNIVLNKVMSIHPEQVLRIDNDLTIVKIIGVPPVRDISRLFLSAPLPGTMEGTYIGLDTELCVKRLPVERIMYTKAVTSSYDMMAYMGMVPVEDNTEKGDCGMPLYVMTALGPIILGVHSLGAPARSDVTWTPVGVQPILRPMIEQAVTHFGGFKVDVDTIVLSQPGYPVVISEVHYKSPVNFITEGEGEVITGLAGMRPGPKTKVTKTIISDDLKLQGLTTDMVPPSKMRQWQPWYIALEARMKPKVGFSAPVLRKAAEGYLADILVRLTPADILEIHAYDLFTAINGAAGVAHIHSIDKNTSMGFPYRKVKKNFLCKDDEGYLRGLGDAVKFTPEIEERIRHILETYMEGKMVNPIFSANLKDEVISKAKDEIGKIRVFTGAPVAWVIVVRMMLLWVARLMHTYNYVFESAAAMNAQSDDWDILYRYLTYFGKHRLVAGDYKGFDTGISSQAIMEAFWVLIQLAKRGGMSQDDIQVIYGISVDTAYNVVDWNGTILRFVGGIPSGHPLTLLLNSIINCLYMRSVYIELNPKRECTSFKSNVHLMTLGDDNVCGVSQDAPWFNHTNIQGVFDSVGITYTMADKTSESKPFIDISEVTFAKRGWRYDEELQRHMCVLEEPSIIKSLHWKKDSGQVSPKAAAIEAIAGAIREYWYYGRERYNKEVAFFRKVVERALLGPYVEPSVFRSYDYWIHVYYARSESKDRSHFWLSNVKYLEKSEIPGLQEEVVETKTSSDIIFTASELEGTELGNSSVDDICNLLGRSPKSPKNGDGASWSPNKEVLSSGNCVDPVGDKDKHSKQEKQNNTKEGAAAEADCCAHKSYESTSSVTRVANGSSNGDTLQPSEFAKYLVENPEEARQLFKIYEDSNCFIHQSEETSVNRIEDSPAESHEEETLIAFFDETTGGKSTMPARMREVFDNTEETVGIEKWFTRPLLIDTFTWQLADGIGTHHEVNPWYTFFNNANNKYKLNNYAYIRCKLKIKIMVNSTPFLYGAYLVSYAPLQDTTITPATPYATGIPAGASTQEIILLSQMPSVWIYPQTQKGGDLDLPFIFNQNWLQTINPSSQFQRMGVLRYELVVPLQSANASTTDGVTINTFCWAEDVELCGPSTVLTFQSKRLVVKRIPRDEYGKGPVSAPASAVAALAGMFRDCPLIGPIATATEMGAKAIAGGAAALGYTNVPVIDPVHGFRPMVSSGFSNSEIGFQQEKLTIDPKNELTIDGGAIGFSSNDELNIKHLVTKESYLGQFQWTQALGEEANLFQSTISPSGYIGVDPTTLSSASSVYGTPLAYFSQLFQFWRGDIILRFKIVASPYHKGRVRIAYDPSGDTANNIVSADTTNVVYSEIFDIGDTDEFEVRVPYMQPLEWSNLTSWNTSITTANAYNVYNSTFSFAHVANTTNGTLVMHVLNELSAPATSAKVYVMVFVRGAENLEFAGPSPTFGSSGNYTTLLVPQSLETTETVMGKPSVPKPERYLTNFGEGYVSLRQLLRRVTKEGTLVQLLTASKYNTVYRVMTRYPMTYGFDANGLLSGNKQIGLGAATFNFCTLHPVTWVQSAFLATRGSMIWYFNAHTTSSGTGFDTKIPAKNFMVTRSPIPQYGIASPAWSVSSVGSGDMAIMSNFFLTTMNSGSAGMAVTDQSVQPMQAVTLPNYNNYLFNGTNPTYATAPSTIDGANNDVYAVVYDANDWQASSDYLNTLLHSYCGIGTDYTVMGFLHCPVAYVLTSQPTPA